MENVLHYLLNHRNKLNDVIEIDNIRNAIPGLSPEYFQDCLDVLDDKGYINVDYAENDIYGITVLPPALHYFQDKQLAQDTAKRARRKDNVRWLITTGIAVVALISSIAMPLILAQR